MISNNPMMKYGEHYATTMDSWITTNIFNKEFTYYTARMEYMQIGTRDLAANWPLFSIEIDFDDNYTITERKVLTILDAFSIVGGLMGIAFTFA
jgi:hypothetical protein